MKLLKVSLTNLLLSILMASPIMGATRRTKGSRAPDNSAERDTSRELLRRKKKKKNRDIWDLTKLHMERTNGGGGGKDGKSKGKGTGQDTETSDDCPYCITDEIFINEVNYIDETGQFIELVYTDTEDIDISALLLVFYNESGYEVNRTTVDFGNTAEISTNGLNLTSVSVEEISSGVALVNTTVDVLGTIDSNSIGLEVCFDNGLGSSLELLGKGCFPEDFVWSIVALPNTLETVNNFQEISGCVSSCKSLEMFGFLIKISHLYCILRRLIPDKILSSLYSNRWLAEKWKGQRKRQRKGQRKGQGRIRVLPRRRR